MMHNTGILWLNKKLLYQIFGQFFIYYLPPWFTPSYLHDLTMSHAMSAVMCNQCYEVFQQKH